MMAVKHTRGTAPAGLGKRYAALLAAQERAETKLRRALRAWDKSLAALKRAEKRLDADFAARATEGRP